MSYIEGSCTPGDVIDSKVQGIWDCQFLVSLRGPFHRLCLLSSHLRHWAVPIESLVFPG